MGHTFHSIGVKRASDPWIVPLQAKTPAKAPFSLSVAERKAKEALSEPFPAHSSGSQQQLSFFVEGVNRPRLSSISGAQKCLTLPDLALLYFIFFPLLPTFYACISVLEGEKKQLIRKYLGDSPSYLL